MTAWRRRGAWRLALTFVFVLAGCASEDPRVAAEISADERWTEVKAALEVRRGLSRELALAARTRTSEAVALALEALNTARQSTSWMPMMAADLADPSKVAAWMKAQSELARCRTALAAAVGARELGERLDGADVAFTLALERYDAAARAYDATLPGPGNPRNPLTGRHFLPRACFTGPPCPGPR
jgi:hypothetical protein